MLPGQTIKPYCEGIAIDVAYINRNPHLFAKFQVVANRNCVSEVTVRRDLTFFTALLRGSKHEFVKELRPSYTVWMKDHQLVCHPNVACNIERLLSDFLLNQVEAQA